MRFWKKLLVRATVRIIVLLLASNTSAQQLNKGSLFSDYKACKVGDIITVYIIEFSSATNQAATSTENENRLSLSSDGGKGALKFIPLFGFGAEYGNQYQGEGVTSQRGSLKAKLSAKIVGVDRNGNLRIEGKRVIDVNGSQQVIVLTGSVRPEDITADNIVYSYNIADAKISYKGRGDIHSGHRLGWITRLINWIF